MKQRSFNLLEDMREGQIIERLIPRVLTIAEELATLPLYQKIYGVLAALAVFVLATGWMVTLR